MSRWSRYLFFVILISVFSMFGCSGVSSVTTTTPPVTPPASGASYQIVTISDLHFNPLYDSTLFQKLVNSLPPPPGNPNSWNPSAWQTIFQGSSVQTPSAAGTDTNYKLLTYTLASMGQNMESNPSPIILFTGDLLGHNIPANYCIQYLISQSSPVTNAAIASCMAAQSAAIQEFINYTFTFVASQIQTAVGSAPVIYAPGNIDAYSGGYGPDPTFLQNNEPTVWNQFLEGAADPTFTTTFPGGGYYFFQYFPPNSKTSPLRIIALNSNSFVQGSPTLSDDASTELGWLGQQLQAAKTAGQKVWILMHVPPGMNSQLIAQEAAVPSDVDENDAAIMWNLNLNPTPQATFISTLQEYPGVVTLILAGHTHMDEFRILDSSGDVLEQLPGISPCFGNNPAYKVITVTQNTFTPTDYQSFDFNLASELPLPFLPLYDFSSTYGAQGTLANSLGQLYPQLNSNPSTQDMYTFLYTSGSTSVNTVTGAPWNPINDVNWPIFGCTIGYADQSDYVTCVDPSEANSTDSASSSPPAR